MLTPEVCDCGRPLGIDEIDKQWTHSDRIYFGCKNPHPHSKIGLKTAMKKYRNYKEE